MQSSKNRPKPLSTRLGVEDSGVLSATKSCPLLNSTLLLNSFIGKLKLYVFHKLADYILISLTVFHLDVLKNKMFLLFPKLQINDAMKGLTDRVACVLGYRSIVSIVPGSNPSSCG